MAGGEKKMTGSYSFDLSFHIKSFEVGVPRARNGGGQLGL